MIIRDDNGLELRAIEQYDKDFLKELINDPEIESMVYGWSYPVSDHQQINWISSLQNDVNDLKLMIEAKNLGAIGVVSLTNLDMKNSTANINIKLQNKENVRNQGFGYRAIDLMVNYSFNQLNLNCLIAEILDHNIPSQKLFKKSGFKYEGTLRDRAYKNGGLQSLYSYSLLKKDYE